VVLVGLHLRSSTGGPIRGCLIRRAWPAWPRGMTHGHLIRESQAFGGDTRCCQPVGLSPCGSALEDGEGRAAQGPIVVARCGTMDPTETNAGIQAEHLMSSLPEPPPPPEGKHHEWRVLPYE
jgi:hypothetical protein